MREYHFKLKLTNNNGFYQSNMTVKYTANSVQEAVQMLFDSIRNDFKFQGKTLTSFSVVPNYKQSSN